MLEFRATVPNDNRENLEIQCETHAGDDQYTLRYPAWKDGKASGPSETIFLTGKEFDHLNEIVNNFRKAKEALCVVQSA